MAKNQHPPQPLTPSLPSRILSYSFSPKTKNCVCVVPIQFNKIPQQNNSSFSSYSLSLSLFLEICFLLFLFGSKSQSSFRNNLGDGWLVRKWALDCFWFWYNGELLVQVGGAFSSQSLIQREVRLVLLNPACFCKGLVVYFVLDMGLCFSSFFSRLVTD